MPISTNRWTEDTRLTQAPTFVFTFVLQRSSASFSHLVSECDLHGALQKDASADSGFEFSKAAFRHHLLRGIPDALEVVCGENIAIGHQGNGHLGGGGGAQPKVGAVRRVLFTRS